MQTHKQCGLKYAYRYVDRLPEPEDADTTALQFGSYIHQVLEDGVKATSLEEMVDIADRVKGSYTISEKYDGKDLKCFENFLSFNKNLGETVGVELVFKEEIAEGITVNGIIDRVIKGDDGGYLIIDYKTSKRQKTKVDLFQDTQLKGYTFAISKMYGVPVSKIVAAHYYPLTNTFVHVRYSQPQINAHVKKVINEVWTIRKKKKEDFKPSRNEFCNWCAYKGLCPEYNDPHTCKKNLEDLKARKKMLAEEKKKKK
jgi:RecB family exonuclease